MGKSHRGSKEYSENQRLKEENRRLKREVSKLRKAISRVDMEHYGFVQDLLTSIDYEAANPSYDKKQMEEDLRNKWKCFECDEGVLKLIVLFKANEEHYFRKCDNCSHKTKMKKYTKDVQGVK